MNYMEDRITDFPILSAVDLYRHEKKYIYMSHFSYACKTEGENGISRLISALCINCLSAVPEYSRFIDYSIIWMSI